MDEVDISDEVDILDEVDISHGVDIDETSGGLRIEPIARFIYAITGTPTIFATLRTEYP